MADCIFCKIAVKEIPADLIYEDENLVAFNDINPQAPVHFLVVPKKHIVNLLELGPADAGLLAQVHRVIVSLARKRGIADAGFRVVINTKENGGQTVPHLHFHVLGGRFMDWPPG
ncbi:histidine triad nucleotide-binding protein [Gelria sp. Kuro-4]|uniref:histidine triad nucleotide-binding protein n=1 Tax=Gelria sp. Kuro-4 TaxID=2796927 RepID=UPI001BEDBE52|nr:histidine triad nucleotide-binding protein [Gelria sp. Kuro-4]MDI3523059.1 histidine triad family protein [Bacillota bacterium]MDK2926488.1 histidine triad family protein [Bacillota bacterium]BCV25645.1 histidine triad nucleotide-binding protein [Gelria sp. Kuro-4]